MPNHCENDLYVRGDEKRVAEFLTFIGADREDPKFDFDKVIPYPEKFKQMDEEAKAFSFFGATPGLSDEERAAAREAYKAKWGTEQDGFNFGGYEWCCNNWGTKWNAYEIGVYDHPRGTCITFQTAWSPPEPVIRKLFELFPDLYFDHEYFECGAAVCGGLHYNPDMKEYDEDPVSQWSGDYAGPRGG